MAMGSSDKNSSEQAESGPSATAPLELEAALNDVHGHHDGVPEPVADGSWLRGTWLLCTSTSQPTLLALPFGIAALGWAGGMIVLAVAAVVTTFCNLLVAKLFEYGGKKHVTYRALSKAVMGSKHRFAYQIVLIPQFVVIVGVGIANLILAGQCLQAVYELLCVGECSVNKYAWQLVAGLALMVVAQLPSMSHAEVVTMITTFFLITYSTAAVVLSIIQGGGDGADYSIPGNTINRTMNGFNAIGIVVFTFTNNATLRPDARTGSSYHTIRRSILLSYSIITVIYIVVSAVGYWAYGNTVSSFLLTEFTHPKWLITMLNIMCTIQLLVGEQVFEWVLYDSWENKLVRKFPRTTWLRRSRTDAEGRTFAVPSRACMLAVRIPYITVLAFVAAACPFFSSIMGFVGAVGLTPLCYVLPCYLYMLARGRQDLGPAAYWGLAALAITFAGVGTLAAIGSVRSIVLSIQQHDFFS